MESATTTPRPAPDRSAPAEPDDAPAADVPAVEVPRPGPSRSRPRAVPPPSAAPGGPAVELDAAQARRIMLRAQGLAGPSWRRAGVAGMFHRLGAVQLDTISVLARSHELVPYARLGAVPREAVERAYWSGTSAFEYWSHAACVLPMEEWPYYGFRRRARTAKGHRWHLLADKERSCAEVLAKLRAEGPLTAAGLGGAKNGGEWFDWSETKIAVEWLLDTGEVVCTRREGWRRVYDLADRAVPAHLRERDADIGEDEALRHLVRRAGRALGVATRADLAAHQMLRAGQVARVVADAGLVPVTVAGWGRGGGAEPAWADPDALDGAAAPGGRRRTVLLSPFDSLVWDRQRVERVFGFRHRLEAYVPRHKRRYGYFAMPVLSGGRLVGRVDPVRDGRTLVARQVAFGTGEPGTRVAATAVRGVAAALREAASWAGCDGVRVERVEPSEARAPLAAAVAG